jgi:hypothetical protein
MSAIGQEPSVSLDIEAREVTDGILWRKLDVMRLTRAFLICLWKATTVEEPELAAVHSPVGQLAFDALQDLQDLP